MIDFFSCFQPYHRSFPPNTYPAPPPAYFHFLHSRFSCFLSHTSALVFFSPGLLYPAALSSFCAALFLCYHFLLCVISFSIFPPAASLQFLTHILLSFFHPLSFLNSLLYLNNLYSSADCRLQIFFLT